MLPKLIWEKWNIPVSISSCQETTKYGMPESTKQKHLLNSSCLLQHSVLRMSTKWRGKKTCLKIINENRIGTLANKMWRTTGREDSICHFYFVLSFYFLAEFFTVNFSFPMFNIPLRYLRSRNWKLTLQSVSTVLPGEYFQGEWELMLFALTSIFLEQLSWFAHFLLCKRYQACYFHLAQGIEFH